MAYSYTGFPTGAGMSSTGSPGVGGGGGGGANFAAAAPYLQLALQLYQGLSKPGAGEATMEKLREEAQRRGIEDFHEANAPSILSKRKQAGMQVGETALNFVPVVGPLLSAGASAVRAEKTAAAQQKFVQKLLAANPQLSMQGGVRLKPEFVPQNNWLARYADSQPKAMQKGASYVTGGDVTSVGEGAKKGAKRGAAVGTVLMPGVGTVLGGVAGGIMGAVAGKVGSKRQQQAERQAAIHKANVKKLRAAQAEADFNAKMAAKKQAEQARLMGGAGKPTAGMATLAQMLGPQLAGRMPAPVNPLAQRQPTQPLLGGLPPGESPWPWLQETP